MSGRVLERQHSLEQTLADEQRILRELEDIRAHQDLERTQDRVLYFEESGAIKIVSYSETQKETVSRDPEGKEQIDVAEISIDEKNELDNIYDIISEYEQEEVNMDEQDNPEITDENEKAIDDDFIRETDDDIDRDDDMDY